MGAYGDGISDALAERLLGVSPEGVSENDIERALEERAEEEMAVGAEPFRQWLVDYATTNGGAGVALVCTVVGAWRCTANGRDMTIKESQQDYLDRVANARRAVERDYVAYRVNASSEAERDEIAARLAGGE